MAFDSTPDQPGPQARGGRRGAIVFAVVLLLGLAAAAVFVVAGGGDETTTTADSDGCESVPESAPKQVDIAASKAKAPTASSVIFATSCGSFTVALDAERAPKTAASFQYLAEEGVFDDTPFHRVIKGFVVQGGDPVGDGTGGPGYTVTERPPSDLSYTRGLVAMAKTPAEPPGTSGSQFFVVTAPADAGLSPDFALAGEISEGMETIDRIEALADPASPEGTPTMPVVINSATAQ